MNETPMTPDQLAHAREIAGRAEGDPFYVSDCEGSLALWRESALTHVRRTESGEITMCSFPSSYRSTDQVVEIVLDSWDSGEDAGDDQRRQDIGDMADARALLGPVLAEVERLRGRAEELTQQRDDLLVEDALAERERDEQPGPLIVDRFDVAMEPAPEEDPLLTIGAIARGGRPVALQLDPRDRLKVARWLIPNAADDDTGLASYGLPWLRCLDSDEQREFLGEISSAALGYFRAEEDDTNVLRDVEHVCATYRLAADANCGKLALVGAVEKDTCDDAGESTPQPAPGGAGGEDR